MKQWLRLYCKCRPASRKCERVAHRFTASDIDQKHAIMAEAVLQLQLVTDCCERHMPAPHHHIVLIDSNITEGLRLY
jgi:hypothetical protein